jgi:nitronate monooxygenase
MEEVNDPKFDFGRVLEEIRRVFQELGIALGSIPLIPAGGINSFQKLKELFDMGAAGAQIGTPFAVTEVRRVQLQRCWPRPGGTS